MHFSTSDLPDRIERILVLRLSAIGDVVLTSPLLRRLRQRFPQAQIDFVIKHEFADLVRHNPHLSDVHTINPGSTLVDLRNVGKRLRQNHYDLAIDLHRNFRTALLLRACKPRRVLRFAKPRWRRFLYVKLGMDTMAGVPPVAARYLQSVRSLGVTDDCRGSELFWADNHKKAAELALSAVGGNDGLPLVGLAPGAGFATKRWPVAYFAELARLIFEEFGWMKVVVLGSREDRSFGELIRARAGANVIDLTGRCSLLASAVVVKRCRLLVANDSGLMHVAEAVRTPVIMMAGSTTRALGFFPQSETTTIVEHPTLDCRPCSHLGYERCPRGHFRCMLELTPDLVMKEVRCALQS